MIKLLRLSAIGMACLLMLACAKNNVKETLTVANTGLPTPNPVYIYNFAVNSGDIKTNSGMLAKIQNRVTKTSQSEEEMELAREVADAMATELTQNIQALGLNTLRADQSTQVRPGSMVITGAFVNIDEGNKMRRNAIGLGMGQSSLDSKVSVLAITQTGEQELLAFDAHADSGSMPGAAVAGPVGAASGATTAAVVATNVAVGAAKTYKSSSAQQAKGMANKITTKLASYFAQQGWINPSLAQ